MDIDPEEWPDFSQILDRMLDVPSEGREDWVRRLDGSDAVWAPRLLNLLRSDNARFSGWFDTIPKLTTLTDVAPGEWHARSPGAEREGSEIGPYRLVRLLGRGGMGGVWYAERSDGLVRRGIALKLPYGLQANELLAARFGREREIVASLSHPNIARLYDAGISSSGQPYLALEYVDGKPLDDYCDHHGLDVRARIELFLQVLDAVQYAHNRLVIHRDIKPSNILVSEDGTVRLLDFGVAKLLGSEAGELAELTLLGAPAITLSYASPEQVGRQAVGTPTDIYSLGVVLFEMLVGVRPYRVPRDTRGALEEAILRADLPLPSTMVSEAAASSRSSTGRALRRLLRGDLDAILLKMLNRQPELRYTTVAAVSEDLGRYLERRAVSAHRPSRWYWLRKFVVRNRLAVASATLASMALLIGAGVALWQGREAERQARIASTERDRALTAVEHREAVDDFMSDLLHEAGRTGKPVSIADLIARADALSIHEFADEPEARAAVLGTVGRFALDFDGIDKALPYFDQALRMVDRSGDSGLRANIVCGRAKMRGILGHVEEAEQAIYSVIGDSQASASAKSECWGDLAKMAIVRYDGSTAERAAASALAAWDSSPRHSPSRRLELLSYQAEAQALNGRPGDAETGYAYVIQELKRLGRERSSLSDNVRTDRFNASLRSGDFNLALAQTDEAIAALLADFPDRPPPAVWIYHRSLVLFYLGRYAEAVDGFERVSRLAASQDRLSQERAELDAAAALSKLGRTEEAERHYRNAIDIATTGLPGRVPSSDIAALLTRAKLDVDAARFAAARENLTLVMKSNALAASLATAHRLRALANMGTRDLDEALGDARAAVDLSDRQRGDKPFSAWVGEAKLVLGQVLQARGDMPGAKAAYADAVQQLTQSVAADHPSLQLARHIVAQVSQAVPAR